MAGAKVFLLRSLCFCFIGKILVKKWYFGLYEFLCSLITLHIRSISTDNIPRAAMVRHNNRNLSRLGVKPTLLITSVLGQRIEVIYYCHRSFKYLTKLRYRILCNALFILLLLFNNLLLGNILPKKRPPSCISAELVLSLSTEGAFKSFVSALDCVSPFGICGV